MVATVFLFLAGIVSDAPGVAPASESELAAYEAARAGVGRDVDAHVRLALWCEEHGLAAERVKHLTLAVLIDAKHPKARGLMGLVAYGGRWLRPDLVGAKVGADPALSGRLDEYHQLRQKAKMTADAQWELALWCEKNGLPAETIAHLTAVTQLDPSREAAWKRLGYKKLNGRWMTEAQIRGEKIENETQKLASKQWRATLEKWRTWLGDSDSSQRDRATEGLRSVVDPRAVPAVWAVFGVGGADRQRVAVQVLGQIDAPAASRALATLAVFSESAEVRRTAIETLRRRDAREFSPLLVALLRDPIKYQVRPVGGPGSPGQLFVEGKKSDLKRIYSPPAAPQVAALPSDLIQYDSSGLPILMRNLGFVPRGEVRINQYEAQISQHATTVFNQLGFGAQLSQQLGQRITKQTGPSILLPGQRIMPESRGILAAPVEEVIPVGQMMLEAEKSALAAQAQLASDVQAIEAYNAPMQMLNSRVVDVLSGVSGQNLGSDRESWERWQIDLFGYARVNQKFSQEKPLETEDVPLDYQPQPIAPGFIEGSTAIVRVSHSCFAAGTPVQALTGPRPIETLAVGDRVLVQDVETGVLSYQPIVAVYHNQPNRTLRIRLEGGDELVATEIHRFWRTGKGWTMARDLHPGDTLRVLGTVARIIEVAPDRVQPVFNLRVAEGESFFVGRLGTLVHDNSVVEPTETPFDTPPSLTSAGDRL